MSGLFFYFILPHQKLLGKDLNLSKTEKLVEALKATAGVAPADGFIAGRVGRSGTASRAMGKA